MSKNKTNERRPTMRRLSCELAAQILHRLGLISWILRDCKKFFAAELARQPETLRAMRPRPAELEQENAPLCVEF